MIKIVSKFMIFAKISSKIALKFQFVYLEDLGSVDCEIHAEERLVIPTNTKIVYGFTKFVGTRLNFDELICF